MDTGVQVSLAAAQRLCDAANAVMGEQRAPAWTPVMQMLIKERIWNSQAE